MHGRRVRDIALIAEKGSLKDGNVPLAIDSGVASVTGARGYASSEVDRVLLLRSS